MALRRPLVEMRMNRRAQKILKAAAALSSVLMCMGAKARQAVLCPTAGLPMDAAGDPIEIRC
jgi:hypothetical protein